ncbi:GCN5-related N-acetyltransferase [Kribbella flavida DSM 17836]|uniref:GCN5-related N-acetyltransferase n=1 Tax=Kribbella flavida (strain DSM 17836 / JCM 10339 / NBRC 14399) TaxID=479435 RepID=D2PSC2_KRIFD|nr:GCN5-related N-acetyltransferase [Kribbella flavida DSM 17836]
MRAYVPDDAEATWESYFRAIRDTASKDYSPAQIAAWAPASADLVEWNERRSAAHTFVAVVDERVVGFSDVTDDGLLDMLFVHPDAGGRGAARALVGAVVAKARELGLAELHTHASRTARPAFERLGFEVERANDQNWIRGENLPNYDMRLTLDYGVSP